LTTKGGTGKRWSVFLSVDYQGSLARLGESVLGTKGLQSKGKVCTGTKKKLAETRLKRVPVTGGAGQKAGKIETQEKS